MARAHGRVLSSIWEDEDFIALTQQQQRLYLFLISQPNLNHAGLLPLTLRRWARKAMNLTAAELDEHLDALAKSHFIVLDDDTEELLIRSFVRNDGVWRMPKVMGAMVSGALEIESKALRRALLAEMDRIPLGDLSDDPTKTSRGEGPSIRAQVADHITTLRRAFGDPGTPPTGGGYGTPSAPPSGTPSATPSEGDGEGDPKGSTRGRAGAHVRAAPTPAPTPAPVPSPVQDGAAEADEQTELVVIAESDFVGAPDTSTADNEPVTAQTIVAEWLDRCTKRPPRQTIGQTSKQIKNLLEEGIHADDIRRGMARWLTKGANPSTIPSFVNEVMNSRPASGGTVLDFATGQTLTGTDATVAGWAAVAAQLANQPTEEDSA